MSTLTYEEFCENPTCQKCHCSLFLIQGCEWPEEPAGWLCGSCATEQVIEQHREIGRLLDIITGLLRYGNLKNNPGSQKACDDAKAAFRRINPVTEETT